MAAKQMIPDEKQLIAYLRDVLITAASPVAFGELKSMLLLVNAPEFEEFSRLSDHDLQALIKALLADGSVKLDADGKFQAVAVGWDAVQSLVGNPVYASIPMAVTRAIPVIGVYGNISVENLQRDIKNSFWWADNTLLWQSLTILGNHYREDTESASFFNFLFKMPQEWLLAQSDRFINICAQRMLPIYARDLQDGHALLDRAFKLAEGADSKTICAMLDYAIMISDWQKVQPLLNRLAAGSAARLTRVAWCRFIQGQDESASSLYLDALTSLRRDERDHNTYFRTIGGLFMPMSELRLGDENSLAMALSHTECAKQLVSDFTQVYIALDAVARSRNNIGLPPEKAVWTSVSPLSDLFCCVAQFWLCGKLTPAQQLLLDRAATLARENGYTWLAEECDEMRSRLNDSSPAGSHRWHDTRNSRMPFMLDCVMTQNSWLERMTRMEQTLAQMPATDRRHLSWNVTIENGDNALIAVKPVEQHFSRNHWSKGRKFTAYRNQVWENIGDDSQDAQPGFEFSAQDKYACYMLKRGEEYIAAHPEKRRQVWAQILQSLVDHPRVYLDGAENHPLKCCSVAPRVIVSRVGQNYRYMLYPQTKNDDNCVVVMENADRLCVYDFDASARQLRDLFGEDFQVPMEYVRENAEILNRLVKRCQIIAETPLPLTEPAYAPSDATPCVRLVPSTRGLRVELLVCPFPAVGVYYRPAEGPVEVLYQSNNDVRRLGRNTQLELDRANEIIEKCPLLGATAPSEEWTWVLNANSAYELSLQLREVTALCRIQWPEDQKYVCRRTLTLGNVSLRTNSYQDWFGVSGEVKLEDSDATISLQELIQSAIVDHKRFIALDDGQVVALSDTLRKNLEDLHRLGEMVGGEKGHLRISPFLMTFAGSTLNNFGGNEINESCEEWLRKYDAAMKAPHAIPKTLNASLRAYQEEGFLWMARLDQIHAGACLADDMGLGKTVQAISMLLSCVNEGPCLIVAPTSVCPNWQAELARFAPTLECEIFGPGDRAQAFKRMASGRVMITSYGLLQSEQTAFRNMHWRVAVLDEAQAIKNSHAKRSRAALSIDADFRLVTTGTPVENNLNELWSIFNFIIPGLLGSRDSFQHKYAAPIETAPDENTRRNITGQLRTLISPFLLRRRKEQVLTELPPKEDIDYYIDLSEEERNFYDNLRRSIAADLERDGENDSKRNERVLCGITMLREAVDHPSMVEGAGGEGLPSSKLEAFLELLRGVLSNDHKVLVFSQFTKFLDIVCRALDDNGIKYEYLDGSLNQNERRRAVEEFQNGEVPVFVSSLKAGCLGLNLTQADYVIHLDSWWNPAVENQASDRAYRLGQKKPVTIYHLRVRDTIDEKIRQLHGHKQNLADQMLENSDDLSTKASMEEIRRILCEG